MSVSCPSTDDGFRGTDMSNLRIPFAIFGLAGALLVYFVVHRISHSRAEAASAIAQIAPAEPSAPGTASSREATSFAFKALTHSLAACQPHLRTTQLRPPQIAVSQLGAPQDAHIRLSLSVDETGSVSDAKITVADFGLPSEQDALLGYARSLGFSVPRLDDCRGRHMEILGDVFEQHDRLGRWSTLLRLYPKYALDAGGNLVTRE